MNIQFGCHLNPNTKAKTRHVFMSKQFGGRQSPNTNAKTLVQLPWFSNLRIFKSGNRTYAAYGFSFLDHWKNIILDFPYWSRDFNLLLIVRSTRIGMGFKKYKPKNGYRWFCCKHVLDAQINEFGGLILIKAPHSLNLIVCTNRWWSQVGPFLWPLAFTGLP